MGSVARSTAWRATSSPAELPPGVPRRGGDLGDDPAAAEARGRALLAEAGAALVRGVEAYGSAYLVAAATRVLDAWGRLAPAVRRDVDAEVREAAERATARVVVELRALLATDPAEQRATPLEVVRSLRREVTPVLRAAGIPPIERDAFEERALPDDDFGLAPRTLGDLGDPDLAPLHLAWGVAKATVIRARAAARPD